MKNIKSLVLAIIYVAILSTVVVLHFGCDEEVSGNDCGKGPFVRDSKSGVCRSLETGNIVESHCCPS